MSGTDTIQQVLNKSTTLIEDALLDLKLQNNKDQAMAESWARVLDLINDELIWT
ncbi:hypothetical protein PAXINDRAFT_11009 [Paxillus involutus ATCC 200175]|nr:hypothetical protein PAXINDRAFT_11009 [Paxillus involutus ATCC 200175]